MEIKPSDHTKREQVILSLAQKVFDSDAYTYAQLPSHIKEFYSFFSYKELIRPLLFDGINNNQSYQALAIKYGINKLQVYYIINKKERYNINVLQTNDLENE